MLPTRFTYIVLCVLLTLGGLFSACSRKSESGTEPTAQAAGKAEA